MITMPKNILQFPASFFLMAGLLIFSACKTSEPTSKTSGQSAQVLSPPVEQINEDSLQYVLLKNRKERELLNYQASATRKVDILHTELDLSFDYQKTAVIGIAKISLTPFAKSQKTVTLDAKDFELGKISGKTRGQESNLNYRYNQKQVEIHLPEALNPGDTLLLTIAYTAFPERNSGQGSEAITDTKGLYFIDPMDTIPGKPRMIWTQGETEHNSKWFPTIDKPNERFTQTIHLTVADSLVTISNGVLTKQTKLDNGMRKDTWELRIPHAPYLAAIAIGDFGKVEAKHEDLPLAYYVEKGYEKGAEKVFAHTPEMMAFFEKKLGVKFPWPKYDQIVVRDFVSGAMENTTASIFMEELRLTEREAIDSEWDYIIAHELFHQWFGDYVTAESWSNLTLNEAFANYSEYLWNEYKNGKDEAKLKLITEKETYFQEALSKKVNLIRFYYEDNEDMFDSHSYSKGGVILHMLREYVGDELFFQSLNNYLTTHALSSVEVHDLRLAFEKTTGEDLNWFFNQWFLDKGHPELEVDVDYSIPENILISVSQRQDLKEFPLYKIPFEVSWYEEGSRKSKRFELNQAFQQFALENQTPVDQIYWDEEKNLLLEKTIKVDSAFMRKQFLESQVGVARYEALDSLVAWENFEVLQELIPNALKDELWSIRELALRITQSHPEWLLDSQDLEDLIFEIAEGDTRNSVRAGAIDVLGAYDPFKYQAALKRYVNDESYLIASSALMGLVALGEEGPGDDFMERFA
ncbi:MAG TPA: peptidase, partial [Algoriphagus sp.]